MSTKLHIQKHNGRWHIIAMHDSRSGPVGSYAVGVGWSTFELARRAFIVYADNQRRIMSLVTLRTPEQGRKGV